MLPYNIHHVAVAVNDLDRSLESFAAQYNVSPVSREVVEEQGVEEAMIAIGGSHIQVLQPLGPDTPVGRFIERNGEGMHHIAGQARLVERVEMQVVRAFFQQFGAKFGADGSGQKVGAAIALGCFEHV